MNLAPPSATSNVRATSAFLDELERSLARIDRAVNLANWEFEMGKPVSNLRGLQASRTRLLTSPGLMEWARDARARQSSDTLSRRLELIERMALDAKLEQNPEVARIRNSLYERLHRFKPKLKGRTVTFTELWDHLWKDADREVRREAYYAQDSLFRSMEPGVRRLIQARNEVAKNLGYRGFAEARLGMEKLSPSSLEGIMDSLPLSRFKELEKSRKERFHKLTGADGWYPWDETYLHRLESAGSTHAFPAQGVVETVLSGVRKWGFRGNALQFKIIRKPNPYVGSQMAIDAPKDVRVVVDPREGSVHYHILFHEFGHAIHSRSVRGESFLLRNHEFAASFNGLCESIAGLFEDIPSTANWLRTRAGLSSAEIEKLLTLNGEATAQRISELTGIVRSELSLYRDPRVDIRAGLHRSLREAMDYDDFTPRSWVDSFYLDTPLYNKSYLISFIFGPQVFEAALRDIGGERWPNPRMGPWLTAKWLRLGAVVDWLPHVREVTGRPLGTAALIKELSTKIKEW